MEKNKAKSVSTQETKDSTKFLTTLKGEVATEIGLDFFVESKDLLIDLKHILKDFYTATYNTEGAALSVKFNNGQRFIYTITACD